MPRPPLLRSLLPIHLPSGGEMVRYAVLGLLVLAAVASTQLLPDASAQDGAAADTQAEKAEDTGPGDRSAAVGTNQASSADRSLAVPLIGARQADSAALPTELQLSSPSGDPVPQRQLSAAGQDGGQLGTQRLEGADVCDDATPGSGPEICARPIETRAGEFAGRRQPQLSAEQRLLAQQAATGAVDDAPDAAARRLGTGRSADFSNDDLALAAAVTSGQTGQAPPAEEETSDIPADATNAIDAILGAIVNAPPPR
jgi:hypothetical protein